MTGEKVSAERKNLPPMGSRGDGKRELVTGAACGQWTPPRAALAALLGAPAVRFGPLPAGPARRVPARVAHLLQVGQHEKRRVGLDLVLMDEMENV